MNIRNGCMLLALAVFIVTYVFLIDGFYRRTMIVAIAAGFLILTGVLTPTQALHAIDWNVMAIFWGMLIIADLFFASRMPAVLAASLARRTKTVGVAILGMCALASVLSMFLENVAVVLILAPIALALALQLKTRAAPFLIGIALSSNLQGAATLVGDPPSMLLGTFAGFTFNDFFWYQGRPGIFFAVQVGAVASFVMLWFLFRKFNAKVGAVPSEQPKSYVPTFVLIGVIVTLAIISFTIHGFPYASGLTVLAFALIGWIWHIINGHTNEDNPVVSTPKISLSRLARKFLTLRERLMPGHRLLRELDWETTFFLVGIFIIIGSLTATGAIDAFTTWFMTIVGGSIIRAYVLIIVSSIILSAFIDNVPFVLAMLPVARGVAMSLGIDPFILYAGLLLGASVGGNITPIGASANIVAYRWIEERAKEKMSFLGYVKYGLPFTIVAVAAATVFGWYAWN